MEQQLNGKESILNSEPYQLEKIVHVNADKQAKAEETLSKQHIPEKQLSDFLKNKFINEAPKHWNLFYKRNTTNFFKDRHWTEREFPELRPSNTLLPNSIKLLEIGCGVGNFVFPLLKSNPALFIYCCDFSEKAIELVTTNTEYDTNRCHGFVCDLTTTDILKVIPENSLDLISAVFCLSAIPPQKLHICIENIQKLLKPGGIFLFRDYGLYDAAQLRFKPENKIDDMFYIRTDGTFSLFFTPESIQSLFPDFEVLENGYVVKEIVNRKRDLSMDRVFVQSRLRKKL